MGYIIIVVLLINIGVFIYVYAKAPSFEEIDTELFGKLLMRVATIGAIFFILLGIILKMMHF